jgi:hypothetical protein
VKVYRGPSSKPFRDDSHEFVSQVSSEQLEEGISSKALIKFNITKEANERQAICTAVFEDADFIPMISGLLSRLKLNQEAIAKIRSAVDDKDVNDTQKIRAIQAALKQL